MKSILYVLLVSIVSLQSIQAQKVEAYQADKTRILFLLDASGSMNQEWGGESKIDIARRLLQNLADSLSSVNDKVEFGIRVFGHQFHRTEYNCKDSRLEVPFGDASPERVASVMAEIKAQGHTPIAYSIYLAASDFPDDKKGTNAIILITDGEENCEGDPCAASRLLDEKRISLRPFVVGLNLEENESESLKCIGKYYDAKDEQTLTSVVEVVVSQALNNTTAQVNLLNKSGDPAVTDIPFTLYDHFTGQIRYNFIHTLNEDDRPDTLFLDPVGVYDIEVHSVPPVQKENIRLSPGRHNIIAIDVELTDISIQLDRQRVSSDVQCLVREANSPHILDVRDLNSVSSYLSGDYDLEYLSLPRFEHKAIHATAEHEHESILAYRGQVSFMIREPAIASVYRLEQDEIYRIYHYTEIKGPESLYLLPGIYQVVYRPLHATKADLTRTQEFEIESARNTLVRF